jgi:hypothetical protein
MKTARCDNRAVSFSWTSSSRTPRKNFIRDQEVPFHTDIVT